MAFWTKLIGGGVKEAGEGIKAASEGVTGLFNGVRTALTGVDAAARARIEEALANAEVKMGEMFMDIMGKLNLADAQSGSLFQAGWRPAIGWVCALALALYYPTRIIVGMTIWTIQSYQAIHAFIPTDAMPWVSLPPMPEVGISDILGLVATMLGSSWLRTQEKKAGIAS
jgi:hypothetical protein